MKRTYSNAEKWLFTTPFLFLAIAGAIWLRTAATPEPPWLEIQGVQSIHSLEFSGDGRQLATFFRSQQFGQLGGQIADSQSLTKIADLQLIPDTEDMSRFYHRPVWSRDGKSIASFVYPSFNGTRTAREVNSARMGIWDTASGQLKSDFPYLTNNPMRDSKLQFSPDDKTLIGEGVPPVSYDVATGQRLVPVEKGLSLNLQAKSNDRLGLWAIRSVDRLQLQVVEAKTRRVLWTVPLKHSVYFSWYGDILCLADFKRLLLWDGNTRKLLPSPPIAENASLVRSTFHPRRSILTYSRRTYKPSARSRFSSEEVNELISWDFRSKRVLWRLKTSKTNAPLGWSPDGKWLVVLHADAPYQLLVLDQNGKIQFERKNVDDVVAWSPDSRQLAFIEPERDESTRITIANHIRIQRFED